MEDGELIQEYASKTMPMVERGYFPRGQFESSLRVGWNESANILFNIKIPFRI